jgi:hypothetical protein
VVTLFLDFKFLFQLLPGVGAGLLLWAIEKERRNRARQKQLGGGNEK